MKFTQLNRACGKSDSAFFPVAPIISTSSEVDEEEEEDDEDEEEEEEEEEDEDEEEDEEDDELEGSLGTNSCGFSIMTTSSSSLKLL